jgi:hypothetical protein
MLKPNSQLGDLDLQCLEFLESTCDNILSGYLCAVTTVFSQQDGIYGFKFLTRFFWRTLAEISLFCLF